VALGLEVAIFWTNTPDVFAIGDIIDPDNTHVGVPATRFKITKIKKYKGSWYNVYGREIMNSSYGTFGMPDGASVLTNNLGEQK